MSSAGQIDVDGREIALSHPDKVLYPQDGITKRDMVEYYRRIASRMVPHCRDRALSMQRFPDGIGRDGFFQKHVPDHFPAWIERAALPREEDGGKVQYVVAGEAATLVYLASQACVTPHLSLSRVQRPHHPDRLIFDLDPSDDDFDKVCFGARAIRRCLADRSLRAFVQTTGSRGLHVVVPLDGQAPFDAVRAFARELADRLADAYPDQLTTAQRRDARGRAVFIDWLRNAYGQTAVAPYAVRALPGAPVATPIAWEELVGARLQPRRYTIANMFRRLAQIEDPWADMGTLAQALPG